jgi:hypothetical protein
MAYMEAMWYRVVNIRSSYNKRHTVYTEQNNRVAEGGTAVCTVIDGQSHLVVVGDGVPQAEEGEQGGQHLARF